jgi:hypothetical protein
MVQNFEEVRDEKNKSKCVDYLLTIPKQSLVVKGCLLISKSICLYTTQ